MKELTMKWIKSQKNYIKESSLYMYKFIVEKHINPSIGEIELKNINQTKIQNMINQKASSGNLKTGGPLSEKTILELIRIILQIINYGEKLRLMNGNNIRVKFPKNIIERSVIDVFGDKELFMLYKHILKEISHLNVGILISMYTGIRIGELCALKWKDINIDEGNLIINKTIQKIYLGKYGSKITITSPKSRKAKRVIPLNLKLVSILKMLENTGEYFLTNSSKPMIPSNYRNYYYKVLKLNNIEKKTFHTLRHTFATKCLNLGTDYKVVSELLGHASVKTTIDIYHHISDENKKKCIEKIEFD